MRILTITTEGAVEVHNWDTTDGLLPHLQRAVDGLVDVVRLDASVDMWINDEGLDPDVLPVNHIATLVAKSYGYTHQDYRGPVVLTGGPDDEGNTLGLDEHTAQALLTFTLNRGALIAIPV